MVAVADEGRVVGIAQIKRHRGGELELASIAVERSYRGQGIARALIERLIKRVRKDLWLTCRSSITGFYRKFGFEDNIASQRIPFYFRVTLKVSSIIRLFGRRNEYIAVMVRSADGARK